MNYTPGSTPVDPQPYDEFRNIGDGHVRWLETQAPQPPPRHSYRFTRDWTYLADALAEEAPPADTRPARSTS